jgi:hypothetical protein
MMRSMIVAVALLSLAAAADAAVSAKHGADHGGFGNGAKDRACTAADVARFEAMLGGIRKGEYRTDPRFQITIHYLGTAIVGGTCEVALRPAD